MDLPALPSRNALITERLDFLSEEAERSRKDMQDLKGLFRFEVIIMQLKVTSSEIWKWAVCKRSEKSGDGGLYYTSGIQHRVTEVAQALHIRNLPDFKAMTKRCLRSRSDSAHFSSATSMEESVRFC